MAVHPGARTAFLSSNTPIQNGSFDPLARSFLPAILALFRRSCPERGRTGVQPKIDNRSDARSNVFLTAVLLGGPAPQSVRVRNLSPRGAYLDGDRFPPLGTEVRLVRGSLSVAGEVAWHAAGHAGLRFTSEIDVPAWVRRIGHHGQRQVDEAVDALRHRQPPGGHVDAPSLGRISDELDGICGRLSASPSMTIEIGEELVKLDALARALQQIARES